MWQSAFLTVNVMALSSEARVEGRGDARKKEKKKQRKVVMFSFV